MTVSIRPARAEKRDTLGALKLRSHVPHVVVAEIAGEIVGFVTVLPDDVATLAELEDLFVAPEAWRKGIGSMLLAEAERRAAALGARSLRVVAGARARPFYEASGFRFAGTVATYLAPAVQLRKDLA